MGSQHKLPANPVAELGRKRSLWWHKILQPSLAVYTNPEEQQFQPLLGKWNLYIGGAGSQVNGYVNVDLYPLAGVTVVCNAVLEHTARPATVLAEIRRCLKPGGFVHVVVPFCHPFHEYPKDYYRFSLDGLKKLVEPLEVVHFGWRTGPTATLLVFWREYVKLWFKSQTMKRIAYVMAAWLLFPLRYLDWFLLRKDIADQMGNHCFVWARKPEP